MHEVGFSTSANPNRGMKQYRYLLHINRPMQFKPMMFRVPRVEVSENLTTSSSSVLQRYFHYDSREASKNLEIKIQLRKWKTNVRKMSNHHILPEKGSLKAECSFALPNKRDKVLYSLPRMCQNGIFFPRKRKRPRLELESAASPAQGDHLRSPYGTSTLYLDSATKTTIKARGQQPC